MPPQRRFAASEKAPVITQRQEALRDVQVDKAGKHFEFFRLPPWVDAPGEAEL